MSQMSIFLLRRSVAAKQIIRCLAIMLCSILVSCSGAKEERAAGNVRAVNHTTSAINWMSINGYRVDGGGGRTCCVGLPTRWRPGLTVDVEWEVDPNRYAKIKRRPIEEGAGFDKNAWAEHAAKFRRYRKVVEIHEWPGTESCELNVHIFTCDRVEVTTVCLAIHHPDYPIKNLDRAKEPDTCPI